MLIRLFAKRRNMSHVLKDKNRIRLFTCGVYPTPRHNFLVCLPIIDTSEFDYALMLVIDVIPDKGILADLPLGLILESKMWKRNISCRTIISDTLVCIYRWYLNRRSVWKCVTITLMYVLCISTIGCRPKKQNETKQNKTKTNKQTNKKKPDKLYFFNFRCFLIK